MSSDNPFAAPAAPLRDLPAAPAELASRASRFWAAIVDGLIFIPLFALLFWTPGGWEGMPNVQPLSAPKQVLLSVCTVPLFLAPHVYLLAADGQTIGKWLFGIRIVRPDGSRVGAGRVIGLRYVVIMGLSLIPIGGTAFGFIDDLFIFTKGRRCLHDRLADTIVVRLAS
jgi:uncharacterized RDD family membrane protein YckC